MYNSVNYLISLNNSYTQVYQTRKESQSNRTNKSFGMIRREPPWLQGVDLTPELIYQYQISPKSLNDVLQADLEFLKRSKQPNIVNDQLGQLFVDLDIDGLDSKLMIEESDSKPSDSSSTSSQR